jgi:hypothetical protein
MTLAVPALRQRNPFRVVASLLDDSSADARQAAERDAAFADVGAFARHAVMQDRTGRDARFAEVGWAWQWQLLALWALTRLTVVLKAASSA